MLRISDFCRAILRHRPLSLWIFQGLIPPVVRYAVSKTSLLLSKVDSAGSHRFSTMRSRPTSRSRCTQLSTVNCSMLTLGQKIPDSHAIDTGVPNSAGGQFCSHLDCAEIELAQPLVSIDQSAVVYQLLQPGPHITLKNGYVLNGYGRFRSLARSRDSNDESLRA